MAKIDITELSLYRWRYWLGYGFVAIGLVVALVFVGLYLPGGLSSQEIKSVTISSSIDFTKPETLAIVDLPYHLLQKLSLDIFGLKVFSVKLPSLILAFLSAVGLILVLKRWFKPSVSVLASLIAITTSQFLFIAQDGTPAIMYLLWPVWFILYTTIITSRQNIKIVYKAIFYVMAALSLFTPLSIYVLIALTSAVALHPHLRFIYKQITTKRILIGVIAVLILSIPLIYTVAKNPSLGVSLLGIPAEMPNLSNNLTILGADYMGFTKPGGSTIMTPFFELGSVLIILIGAYHIFRTRASAKSYVIILWMLCLTPVVIFNPDFATALFLPLVLLLSSGLRTLLDSWYGLFPLNPYARFAGLIPLVILVTVLVSSGVDRFMYGYRYDPNIATNFSKDIKLIPRDTKILLVMNNSEYEFYKIVEKYNKDFTVVTEPTGNTFLATHAAKNNFNGYKIKKIITSTNTVDADRFYLYTNTGN